MDDHVAFERQLTRRAQLRSGDAATPQLARILQDVATRRARRGAAPPASPGSAVARATGPTGAADAVWSVETVATDVRIIRTGRPAGLQFRAGQYLKLGVPGNRSGSYSIASAPHDPHLEFCVELIAGGRLSPALFALRPGDPVTLTDRAKGSFVLATAPCHLMVATVTGIAPLRSMLRDALHRGTTDEFIVLHGASHGDELPYLEELTALAAADPRVRYLPTVSRPGVVRNRDWPHDSGRVDDLACRVAAGLDPRRTHVYACGHPEMVKRVAGDLGGTFAVSTEVFD